MSIFGIIGLSLLGIFGLLAYCMYSQAIYQIVIKRDGCGVWFFDGLVILIWLAMNLGIAFGITSLVSYMNEIHPQVGKTYYTVNDEKVCSGLYIGGSYQNATCEMLHMKCNIEMPKAYLEPGEKIAGEGDGGINFENPKCQ